VKRYFQNLKYAEDRRMRYILLVYLIAGFVGIGIGLFFYTINGIIAGIIVSYCVAWKLAELINEKIKLSCPLCESKELTENFTLQCRPAEYECKECKSVYVEGVLKRTN
jgi:hypothetical protein